jgi:hypothetical protein
MRMSKLHPDGFIMILFTGLLPENLNSYHNPVIS